MTFRTEILAIYKKGKDVKVKAIYLDRDVYNCKIPACEALQSVKEANDQNACNDLSLKTIKLKRKSILIKKNKKTGIPVFLDFMLCDNIIKDYTASRILKIREVSYWVALKMIVI